MSSNYCETPELLMNSVLNEIEKSVRNNKDNQFSDEDLVTLHSVFGPVLQRAIDILEKHTTTVYITDKKTRSLVEVKGDRDHCYRIFSRVNFCPCPAFKHQVLDKKIQVTCKHVLAWRIAKILDKTTEHEINQDQYQMLLRSMFEHE